MNVKLLNFTPLEIADIAICKCYGNEPHSDKEKVKARINRVANVSKHASTIEHLSYNFDVDGVSRALLQELSRHRIASYTVKSSRYTLQELKNEARFLDSEGCTEKEDIERASKYIVFTGDKLVDHCSMEALDNLRYLISTGIPNDKAKYCMPDAYKTSLVMTFNARSLQNLLTLRNDSHALWEMQDLAKAIYKILPEEHKFLYENIFE